jgi:hypothetical protein
MNRNSLIKISFYVLCVLIGLLSVWTLYKVYVTQRQHKDIVDKIVGIKPPDENDDLFMPLITR